VILAIARLISGPPSLHNESRRAVTVWNFSVLDLGNFGLLTLTLTFLSVFALV